jgi:hypothetical protein
MTFRKATATVLAIKMTFVESAMVMGVHAVDARCPLHAILTKRPFSTMAAANSFVLVARMSQPAITILEPSKTMAVALIQKMMDSVIAKGTNLTRLASVEDLVWRTLTKTGYVMT